MPLVRIDLVRGRDPEQLRTLLDTVHEAMVAAFGVPETDRYQVLTQHEPGDLIALDTDLGFARTDDLVLLQFTSRERTDEAKTELYRRLAVDLHERCGLAPSDLVVTLVENGPADWSFGGGVAQFVTGDL
ncbi:tautomerase family protein [Pedococcus sp. NPDC057267]|uniref:tautomerase family protein n=1 Tax=Pedococcus sp. NPDC057267 TaxID=3346077 RepID=UPI00363CC3CF